MTDSLGKLRLPDLLAGRPAAALRALVLADLALITGHVVNRLTADVRFLRIDIELGSGEIFQYAKWLVLSGVMVSLAAVTGRGAVLLWAGVFSYLGLDDAFAIHEWIGELWGDAFGLGSGAVPSQAAADLVVAALALAVAGVAVWLEVPGRRSARGLFGGLLAYGIFAGGVDVLARIDIVLETRWLRGLLAVVEEGGEMLTLSLIVAFAAAVLEAHRSDRSLGGDAQDGRRGGLAAAG